MNTYIRVYANSTLLVRPICICFTHTIIHLYILLDFVELNFIIYEKASILNNFEMSTSLLMRRNSTPGASTRGLHYLLFYSSHLHILRPNCQFTAISHYYGWIFSQELFVFWNIYKFTLSVECGHPLLLLRTAKDESRLAFSVTNFPFGASQNCFTPIPAVRLVLSIITFRWVEFHLFNLVAKCFSSTNTWCVGHWL